MIRRCLLILFLVPLFAACAARGPLFTGLQPPAPGKAVIYVYRTQLASRSMDLAPAFWVNGEKRGSVLMDGYIRAEVDPGVVELSLRRNSYLWPGPEMPERYESLRVEPNQTYFMRFSIDHYEHVKSLRTTFIRASFGRTSQEEAMKYLPSLKNVS